MMHIMKCKRKVVLSCVCLIDSISWDVPCFSGCSQQQKIIIFKKKKKKRKEEHDEYHNIICVYHNTRKNRIGTTSIYSKLKSQKLLLVAKKEKKNAKCVQKNIFIM